MSEHITPTQITEYEAQSVLTRCMPTTHAPWLFDHCEEVDHFHPHAFGRTPFNIIAMLDMRDHLGADPNDAAR